MNEYVTTVTRHPMRKASTEKGDDTMVYGWLGYSGRWGLEG